MAVKKFELICQNIASISPFIRFVGVIGDLILISAGIKKMKFVKFSIFMVSGKIVKTIIVVVGLGTIF